MREAFSHTQLKSVRGHLCAQFLAYLHWGKLGHHPTGVSSISTTATQVPEPKRNMILSEDEEPCLQEIFMIQTVEASCVGLTATFSGHPLA